VAAVSFGAARKIVLDITGSPSYISYRTVTAGRWIGASEYFNMLTERGRQKYPLDPGGGQCFVPLWVVSDRPSKLTDGEGGEAVVDEEDASRFTMAGFMSERSMSIQYFPVVTSLTPSHSVRTFPSKASHAISFPGPAPAGGSPELAVTMLLMLVPLLTSQTPLTRICSSLTLGRKGSPSKVSPNSNRKRLPVIVGKIHSCRAEDRFCVDWSAITFVGTCGGLGGGENTTSRPLPGGGHDVSALDDRTPGVHS
jgi:hypothetical protein